MRDLYAFLIRLLRPYRKTILWCSALSVGVALLNMLAPIALGKVVDGAREHVQASFAIVGVAVWLAIQYAIFRAQNYLGRRGRMIANESMSREKFRAVDVLFRKPLSFHHGRKSGDLTEKLSKLEDHGMNVIEGVVFDMAPALLSIIAILAYLTVLDWKISLLLAVVIAGLVWYKYRTLKIVMPLQRAWRAASHEVNSTAWDALHNILIIKSTSAEQVVAEKLEVGRRKMLDAIDTDARVDEQMFNVQNMISYGGSAGALLLSVMNVQTGAFTFGELTAIMAYTFSIFGYVRWFQWQMRSVTRGAAAYKDVQEMLDAPAEAYEGGRAIDVHGGVEFRNVRFRYREDVPVLEDVTFTVAAGERVAVVGESGEGKTTLIDLIGRYHLPQQGAILYDGVDAQDVNLPSLRAQIGLVPQDLPLLHESLGANIRFGRQDATDAEVREAARLASLEKFVSELPDGLDTVVGERGLKLSGGQRQRVALARAFLRNPKILILDEPTSNLDSKTEEEIQRSLETLMRGRTTFIIAHRLRTVRDADRILVLKGGRIVEQGRHAELSAKDGAYAALLRSQGGLVAVDEVKEDDETASA